MNHLKIKRSINIIRWKLWKFIGAEPHDLLRPKVLSETTLSGYERDHGFSMPSDYRHFLQHDYGDPEKSDYRLFDLASSVRKATRSLPDSLKKPFPYTDFFNPADQPDFHNHEDDEAYWDSFTCGTLPLYDEGCNKMHILIVNGKSRGQVWLNAMSSDGGLVPLFPNFNEWYFCQMKHSS